jgi:hypothetical protein
MDVLQQAQEQVRAVAAGAVMALADEGAQNQDAVGTTRVDRDLMRHASSRIDASVPLSKRASSLMLLRERPADPGKNSSPDPARPLASHARRLYTGELQREGRVHLAYQPSLS